MQVVSPDIDVLASEAERFSREWKVLEGLIWRRLVAEGKQRQVTWKDGKKEGKSAIS